MVDTDKSYWLSGDGTAKGAGNVAAADALIGPSSLGDNLVTSPGEHPTGWLSTSASFYQDYFEQNLEPVPVDFDPFASTL